MKKIFTVLAIVAIGLPVFSQDDWGFGEEGEVSLDPAFNDTRVINGHSVETLDAKTFDLRIAHRFGDIAVPNSSRTLFGFDNSSDIRIGFEYGFTDKFMIGLGRSKGAGLLTELFDGLVKYKISTQSDEMPVSMSISGSTFATSMLASPDSTSRTSFTKLAHRFSYVTQFNVAHNFNNQVSVQVSPGFVHRNYVAFDEDNNNFFVGAMAKVKLRKKMSLIAEYYYVNRTSDVSQGTEFVDPLAIGVEFKTSNHVFLLNFMNSRGIGAAQFLPYTSSKWSDGQFRFGFTISRHF
jgi:hypothetical protein